MKAKSLPFVVVFTLQCSLPLFGAQESRQTNVQDLISAVKNKDIPAILAYKGDVNERVVVEKHQAIVKMINALHWAIINRLKEVVQVLLAQKNADANCFTEEGVWTDVTLTKFDLKESESPLHLAVKAGDADIVSLLLKAKANPNAFNLRGAPPVYYAALRGLTEIAWDLINAGADPDATFQTKMDQPIYGTRGMIRVNEKINAYSDAKPVTAESMREYKAFKSIARTFAAITHPRCGGSKMLPADVVKQIIGHLKPVVKKPYNVSFRVVIMHQVNHASSWSMVIHTTRMKVLCLNNPFDIHSIVPAFTDQA